MRPLWSFQLEHFTLHPFGLSAWPGVLVYQWPFTLAEWSAAYLLLLAFGFSVPTWSLERLGIRDSLRRGWTLVKGNWFRVLVAMLMCRVVFRVLKTLLSGLQALVFLIFSTSFGKFHLPGRYGLVSALFPVEAAAILTAPLLPIAITLIYYDVRIRREGFGVEKLMEAAGMQSPQAAPNTESTPSQQTEESV